MFFARIELYFRKMGHSEKCLSKTWIFEGNVFPENGSSKEMNYFSECFRKMPFPYKWVILGNVYTGCIDYSGKDFLGIVSPIMNHCVNVFPGNGFISGQYIFQK